MPLNGDEPELALGDSGEFVMQLQDRLRGLKLLDKFPDGTYDSETEEAVRQMQSNIGLSNDGTVNEQTWQALDEHMTQYGLLYNHYAGPGNQEWDQLAEGQADWATQDGGGQATERGGQISEDGQYRWDGQNWLPNEQETTEQETEDSGPPVIPHIDNIHPAIAGDERFSSFHDFLREQNSQ